MNVTTHTIDLVTQGHADTQDITEQVTQLVLRLFLSIPN